MVQNKKKEPTKTSLVWEALLLLDDFVTASQLVALVDEVSANQVSASLHMLREYRAVECMESDGSLWWYATPENDTRQHQVEMRTPEDRPRRTRVRRSARTDFVGPLRKEQ